MLVFTFRYSQLWGGCTSTFKHIRCGERGWGRTFKQSRCGERGWAWARHKWRVINPGPGWTVCSRLDKFRFNLYIMVFFLDDTPLVFPTPNQESISYSNNMNSKLSSMCKFFNRCNYCLEASNREGGHKNCQIYNQRLSDHFVQYFSRTNEHSLRVTPQYLYHFLQLNSGLSEECLNRLFPHIWEVFNSFYEDFFQFFQTIFKQ